MWRAIVMALILGLSGCTEPIPARFRNTDITGSEFGRSLAGLKDHRGQPRTLADFQGKAVILFFGYTACPDVCPTALSRFSEVMQRLGHEAGRVQVLLVTVDPERDTPELLAAYVTGFNASFIGLYGDMAATEAVAREFKVFFAKSKGGHHHGSNDAIDHSTGAYVFDPAGRIRLYLKDDAPIDAIVSDLKQLLAAG